MSVVISDIALLRFLERAGGLDVAGLRLAIGASLARAAGAAGAIGARRYSVHADGLVYVVIDGIVVTILAGDAPGHVREAQSRR